ncbi:flagellar hook assembly protein [Devosia yakushimensis]|uniref:Basal-body rod modification protein FlgD n=1 Tax=Devosia yakushimensis TaxID=470028 RepID=A0ABQ5U966_9HYPH|nr:flagellar hook assembly protein FlgD [Devosia yakushimensis]GLQ08255.1 flagellar hook assembly protein [Devosia yakushimensis]
MAVDSVSSNTNTSALSGSRTTIAENFDTFLNILTTQLKNQNPLDPLDTNQFTAQLVQFTGVEQQLKTNEFLESLLQSTQSSGKTDAVSYIGKEVTAAGTTAQLKDGGATWAFNAEAQVANATVTIKNANGQVVYTETGSLEKGPGNFLWTGKGSDGNTQPDGIYTIDIKGTNLAGNTIKISTSTVGVVTAVDFSGAQPILTVGTGKILLSDVTNVKIPAATTPPPADSDDETDS